MTILEIILLIILYIIGITITVFKLWSAKINDTFYIDGVLCLFGSIFWPVTWLIRITQAILVEDWKC